MKRLIDEMFRNQQDQIVFIEGDRGSGKSYTGLRLNECIQVLLVTLGLHENQDHHWLLTFDSRDFADAIGNYNDLRFMDLKMYDEPGTGETSHLRQLTLEGQLIGSGVQAFRHKQQILTFAVPSDSKVNLGLRDFKTYLLQPPPPKWRRYIPKAFRHGKMANINKKERTIVWLLKACRFEAALNKSLEFFIRERNTTTGWTEVKNLLIFRHPGKRWTEAYEERKPRDLGRVFRRRYEELGWVKQEKEAAATAAAAVAAAEEPELPEEPWVG